MVTRRKKRNRTTGNQVEIKKIIIIIMTPGLSNSMFDLKFVVKLVMLTMEE